MVILFLKQDEHRKYTEESEKRALRLRQLLEAAEAERRDLATKLEEERRYNFIYI